MHEKKVFTYALLKIVIENELTHLNVLYAFLIKFFSIFNDELVKKHSHLQCEQM